MGDRTATDIDSLPADLQTLAKSIEQAGLARRGNEIALLELLRLLEMLHSYIRDEWFQEALPTNRQRLYALLRDIEISGGWPYIQRMRLQVLLQGLQLELQNPDKDGDPDAEEKIT